MKRRIQLSLFLFVFISCTKEDTINAPVTENPNFISAVDISSFPEIAGSNPIFYDLNGSQKNFLEILKESGINTIRLRLWVHPSDEHSGFNEVKQFSQMLKASGFQTWLSVHYSDTWADPGQQQLPEKWQGIPFLALKDSVYKYTEKVIVEIAPDLIQIGNEINSGFLHPYGEIVNNRQQFIELLQSGILAVRRNAKDARIIVHYAGLEGVEWFFDQLRTIDYDIIGLSYYPIWHGKSLDDLQTIMQRLSNSHNQQIVLAETAYPFTLHWNDWTHNIVGLEEQLILPEYPATKEGQRKFVRQIKEITKETANGVGFCYWGAEWIAWNGNQSTMGSPWENQALFDFDNKALPSLREFDLE